MKKSAISIMSAAALILAWGPTLGAGPANAAITGCAPSSVTRVVQTGYHYSSIGTAVGKYNPTSTLATLSYTLSKTTQRSTTVEAGASMSVGWAMATVEAHVSVTVTSSTTTGSSVTDTLPVAAHNYGFDQAKVMYRTYHIYDQELNPTCTWVTTTDYGYVDAITTYPFFSACVATSPCTPKP